jgi:hypothetical protein
MRTSPRLPALASLEPISLEEIDAQAALQVRMDRKYIVRRETFETLAVRLAGTHRVLEIDGRRLFRYRTTYYDSPDLLTFREHMQGRRRRFKCRKRRYLDTGACALEVKLKGPRGRTEKRSAACDSGEELGSAELAFLRTQVHEAYGRELPSLLRPALTVECRRLTLAAPGVAERVTGDVALELGSSRLGDDYVILETKSATGNSVADRVLRELGARSVKGCSKYCLGVALERPGVRANPLLPLLRRYFGPAALEPAPDPIALAA